MEKHTSGDGLQCTASFYYCPYSPGIIVTHPEQALDMLPFADRRVAVERRGKSRQRSDRRRLQVPVCPQYKSVECPYAAYPMFRNHPAQLLALCHSKSIARYLHCAVKRTSRS